MAKTKAPEIIDNVDALAAKMKEMREAQKIFATYTLCSGSCSQSGPDSAGKDGR